MTQLSIMYDVGDLQGLHLNQKYLKSGKKCKSYGKFTNRRGGWVTPVCIMGDVWNPLGLYLNQKVLKLGKKGPSCGQFTNGR